MLVAMTDLHDLDDPGDLASTWCRMWNDDPALARSLVTDDARVWFGGAQNPDLHGVEDFETFVERYRTEKAVRFTPLTVAYDDGGDRFAYTWQARFPDGRERGGIDFYTLRDGRIAENWSVVGGRPMALPVRQSTVDDAAIAEACADWTRLWNGEIEAQRLVAPGFELWFGALDPITGSDAFAAFIERHRAERPGLRYVTHRRPVIDTERQLAGLTWTAALGERVVGGIDMLRFVDGTLMQVWSVTGDKGFSF